MIPYIRVIRDLGESSVVELGSKTLEGTGLPLVFGITVKEIQSIVDRRDAHTTLHLDDVLARDKVVSIVTGFEERSGTALTLGALSSWSSECQRQQREDGSSPHLELLEQELNILMRVDDAGAE